MIRLPPLPRLPAPLAALLILGSALPSPARAAEASPWVRGAQSEARLIAGDPVAGGRSLVAGLEIRLEPHFITYWRDPGDAGVPPAFSFAGSTNLGSATVLYPAPRRLDEAGAVAYGYGGDVTFPILVRPADPSKPVDLVVALDYAACHDICLPAHADLRLALDGHPSAESGRVSEALAAVPRVAALGAPGRPSILATAPDGAGGFTVTASGPAEGATLFVEAPEGWAFEAGPARAVDGATMFPVKRLDHPEGVERPPAPLTLTLATAEGAVEVPVRLDATGATP